VSRVAAAARRAGRPVPGCPVRTHPARSGLQRAADRRELAGRRQARVEGLRPRRRCLDRGAAGLRMLGWLAGASRWPASALSHAMLTVSPDPPKRATRRSPALRPKRPPGRSELLVPRIRHRASAATNITSGASQCLLVLSNAAIVLIFPPPSCVELLWLI
jgi:hypothetical protein